MADGTIQDVPVHIRCRDRNLIDSRYPIDEGRWWNYETVQKGKPKYHKQVPARRSKYIDVATEFIRKNPGATSRDLAKALGIKGCNAYSILDAMDEAVYEWKENGATRYALVEEGVS